MALAYHYETALAVNDSEGTDGGNTVGGAVVTAFTPSGDVAMLYDDESGTNGSTAKQTKTSGTEVGTVEFWIEEGIYDIYMNGVYKRRVIVNREGITGVIKSYATTAEIEALEPTVTGTVIENQERANAKYVLATSGYTALPGDIVAANGRVWELQIDGKANVLWFGAVADWDGTNGTDNYQPFMDAKDRANHVFVPDGSYSYSRALRMDKPDFKWECESPATLMYCTGIAGAFARFPEYSSVLLGTYTTKNIERNSEYSLNSVVLGDTVTLANPSDDANFNIGDVVFISSEDEYDPGSGDLRPIWGQLTEITGVESGVLSLKYPTEEIGDAKISNMTSGTSSYFLSDDTDTSTPNFAAKNVSIIGGTWVNGKNEAPFAGGGGALNCVIDVHTVEARNGPAYGNLYGYCNMRVNSEYDRKSPVELAYCSHGNNVNITYAGIFNAPEGLGSANGAVWINESSRNNEVRIGTLNSSDYPTLSAVQINVARYNRVNIGSYFGTNVSNSIIDFNDPSYTGTKPNTEHNEVVINSNYADCTSGVRFRGNGQEIDNSASLNSVATHVNSIYFDNSKRSKIFNSHIESGAVLNSNGSDFIIAESYIAEGLTFDTDADIEIDGNFQGMSTSRGNALKSVSLASLVGNATNASPYTKTRTVNSGSFGLLDKIEIYFDCFISGTLSSDNKTFALSFAGTNIVNLVTTAAGSEVMFRGYITYATNSAVVANIIVYEGNSVVDTKVLTIGGLDLNSNDYELVVTVTPENASDTLNIRNYRVKPYSANAGEF